MERIAVYPGTFDPITNGHLDVIFRGSNIFDKVVVAVSTHPKKMPLFTLDERVALIEKVTRDHKNVTVDSFNGLLVDYAESIQACAIVRGLRAVSDFEFETQMALVNRKISSDIVTIFLVPNERYTYLNSTIVKEVASLGGDVSNFLPSAVLVELTRKFDAIKR
ncbi:MAG: pantetheine-phosphate adenylyltransferase [Calditrichaeota bacterium]|nr:MAG: pantetheine-phosphate adenylyltransferase [Calditrichota bacterium]